MNRRRVSVASSVSGYIAETNGVPNPPERVIPRMFVIVTGTATSEDAPLGNCPAGKVSLWMPPIV